MVYACSYVCSVYVSVQKKWKGGYCILYILSPQLTSYSLSAITSQNEDMRWKHYFFFLLFYPLFKSNSDAVDGEGIRQFFCISFHYISYFVAFIINFDWFQEHCHQSRCIIHLYLFSFIVYCFISFISILFAMGAALNSTNPIRMCRCMTKRLEKVVTLSYISFITQLTSYTLHYHLTGWKHVFKTISSESLINNQPIKK